MLVLVVCGCKTWPVTLRAESRLRVFKNRELRKIFGPKREEVVEVFIIDMFHFYWRKFCGLSIKESVKNSTLTAVSLELV
jgi:hypothetical protein